MPDSSHHANHQLLATAAHHAGLSKSGISGLAALLDVRARIPDGGDTLAARAAIDAVIGGNRDTQLEAALHRLRAEFAALQKKAWVADLEKELKKSPDEAWPLFLNRYAEAMYHWRTQLMWWWADTALGETPENDKTWFKDKKAELLRIREQSKLIEHGRWPEAYPFFRELAGNQILTSKLRAQFWAVCGSIQMYYNTLPDARSDLAEAEKLCPQLPYLPVCRADLERVAGDIAASRVVLENYLAAQPPAYELVEAYIAMGRSFAEEKNLGEAERWFDKAIETDPGNASAYRNKMALLGKDEAYFAKNKEKIPELVQLADRADPENDIANLLEAGYTYQVVGDLDSAAACFQKAHKADPERLEPMTAIGALCQAQQKYDEAADWFTKVLHLAPGSVDGYWNLAALCAEQGKHQEAADWYKKALPHCPMFARTLHVKAGEMYIAASEFGEAKAACTEALKMDPDFDYALNTLHDVSDKLRNNGYDDKTGPSPALDVLSEIRSIKGEAYEANFQNRSGNVYYYFADYQLAAEHYRRATAVDASLAVYHDNLAGTLDKLYDQTTALPTLTEALQAAQAAARLEPANDGYRQQASRLDRKLLSLRHFGVLPEERSADISPIRVRFREELYPWLVKDGDLVPDLMQKIENLRAKFKEAYGVTIPGVRFSTDWNIVPDANFVVDFDGIPLQQGWLIFSPDTSPDNGIDTLILILEQQIQFNLADFIHYDSPEVSAKFVGKTAFSAATFFQVVRVLLKQKISINAIDTIHEIYEASRTSNKDMPIQGIAQNIRCHPAILPGLPVNTAASRTLIPLTPEQEQYILANTGESHCKESLWQIRQGDSVLYDIINYLPKTEYAPGGHGQFVVTQNPKAATLLNDLSPGTFFSRGEILNLTKEEKTAIQ